MGVRKYSVLVGSIVVLVLLSPWVGATPEDRVELRITLIGEGEKHYFRWKHQRVYPMGSENGFHDSLLFQKVRLHDSVAVETVPVRSASFTRQSRSAPWESSELPQPPFDLSQKLAGERVQLAYPAGNASELSFDTAGVWLELGSSREHVLGARELEQQIWYPADRRRSAGAEIASGAFYYYRVRSSWDEDWEGWSEDLLVIAASRVRDALERSRRREPADE